ncbi:hypothetical protein [Streptomyces sp. NPDC058279]|uniref:hypothetical protein n=1 Tax=Streptomyces sp. NPDC058279 TaxID=3346418 RepID=UPI0036EA1054
MDRATGEHRMRRHRLHTRLHRHAVGTAALVLAATACGGGGDQQVSQEGKGGYPWVATDEICNALPYGKLADPLGAREDVADRTRRTTGGYPGAECVQQLVQRGPATYGGAKVELDFAYVPSVDEAKEVFAKVRGDAGKDAPGGAPVDVEGVGKEAYRLAYTKPDDQRQVRQLRVRDSNLMLDITVTGEAHKPPTPESLKALDDAVNGFAKGCLTTIRRK